jgi:hypothetical protein
LRIGLLSDFSFVALMDPTSSFVNLKTIASSLLSSRKFLNHISSGSKPILTLKP